MVVDIEWKGDEIFIILFWAKGRSVRVQVPPDLAADGKVRGLLHWLNDVLISNSRP